MFYHVKNKLEHWCVWICEIYKYVQICVYIYIWNIYVYIYIWNAHPSCFSSKSGWSNSVKVANVLWKLPWRSVHISLSYTHYVKHSICGKVTHVINKNRAGRESLLLSSRWGPYRLKWAFAPVTPGPKKISVHGGTSLDSNINSWKSLVKKILVSICYKSLFKTFLWHFYGAPILYLL